MAILDANRPLDKPLAAYPKIPPDIHAKLRIRAKKHFRSIKAEIEAIVAEAILADERGEQQWPRELERK